MSTGFLTRGRRCDTSRGHQRRSQESGVRSQSGGRRQEAGGRRQEAGGRRQEAGRRGGGSGPLNALGDEHRFLKPGKEVRYLPGAPTRTGTGERIGGTGDLARPASPRPPLRAAVSGPLRGAQDLQTRFRGATSRRGRLKSGRVEVQILPEPLRTCGATGRRAALRTRFLWVRIPPGPPTITMRVGRRSRLACLISTQAPCDSEARNHSRNQEFGIGNKGRPPRGGEEGRGAAGPASSRAERLAHIEEMGVRIPRRAPTKESGAGGRTQAAPPLPPSRGEGATGGRGATSVDAPA